MVSKNVHKILTRFAPVRPEETSSTVLMFFYFFLITSSAYVIKPVKISLYLEWLTFEKLPYAYLLTALLIGFFVSVNTRLLYSMDRRLYISLSLVFFIVSLFLFWGLFRLNWPWLSLIFWFWADMFTATSVTQFWILVNDIYHPRQARRVIGFLVSGGLLGGVAGALLSSLLAKAFGTENLLLCCPFFLALCLVIVNRVPGLHQKERPEETDVLQERKKKKVGVLESFKLISSSRHLILLSGIVVASIVVTTLIDFQFNSVVDTYFQKVDSRTAFLGAFFTGLLIFSYFLHLLATNRILRSFGIRYALLIAPVLLLMGALAVFLVPAGMLIYWAVYMKGADKSLAHSLSQSVRELLFIPISPEIKYKVKIFVDLFVNKFAKGLGAFLLLLFFSVFRWSIPRISIVVLAFIALWIGLNLLITREYVGIVKKNLKVKWQDADKFISEKIDVDMTKLVFDTLQSKNRSSVLYAMHLFDIVKSDKMSPELRKIITGKSNEIRASSMDSLLELDGEALFPYSDDSLDEEELSKQVKEIMALDVYQEIINKHIDKVMSEDREEADISKMESAKLLGLMEPSPSLIRNLGKLLKEKSPEVAQYAMESAGKLKRREFVPLIVRYLSHPTLQRVASRALSGYGPKIAGTLKDYLSDPEEELKLRRAIPEILVQIGTQKAADMLALEMRKREHDMEPEMIEAMFKLRERDPLIHFPEDLVVNKVISIVKKCYHIVIEIHDLMKDEAKTHMASALEKTLARSLKHIFELLSLVHSREDVIQAYQNISAGTRKSLDYSLELLDNILKREIKEILIPLIDDIPFDDKVKKCRKMLKTLEKIDIS